MKLWAIFVPTIKRNPTGKNLYYSLKYHRIWDKFVRDISGGLTILPPTKGQWIAPDGELFVERMIQVYIACTEEQIEQIADLTAKHYDQLAVMYYLVSNDVRIKHYPSAGP